MNELSNLKIKKEIALKNNDIYLYNEYIYKCLSLDYKNLEPYLRDCNNLINYECYEDALKLYKILINLNYNNYEVQLEYLKNKLDEVKFEKSMDELEIKNYKKHINFGKKYYELKDYESALYFYVLGLNKTKHNIFNYYIGKCLYKLNYNDDAIKYLEKYNLKGTKKISKSILYLTRLYIYKERDIMRKKNNKEEYFKLNNSIRIRNNILLEKCKKLSTLGDFEFILDNLYIKKNKKVFLKEYNHKIH